MIRQSSNVPFLYLKLWYILSSTSQKEMQKIICFLAYILILFSFPFNLLGGGVMVSLGHIFCT